MYSKKNEKNLKKVLEYRRLDLLPNLTDLYCNLYILFCSNSNCKP